MGIPGWAGAVSLRAGLAQGMDENSVCLLHGEAMSRSGAGSRAGSKQANKRGAAVETQLRTLGPRSVTGCHRRAGKCSFDSECTASRCGCERRRGLAMAARSCSSSAYIPVGTSSVRRSVSCVCVRARARVCVCVCVCSEGGTGSDFLTHSLKVAFIF